MCDPKNCNLQFNTFSSRSTAGKCRWNFFCLAFEVVGNLSSFAMALGLGGSGERACAVIAGVELDSCFNAPLKQARWSSNKPFTEAYFKYRYTSDYVKASNIEMTIS